MSLAIFDLDNTLLAGDSDYAWGQFLVEQNIVDAEAYEAANRNFYEQYQQGTLDIYEFCRFSFQPLAQNAMPQLLAWREHFINDKILSMITDKARKQVEQHRDKGDTLMIITATNRFITEPVAELFAIPHLLATEPEIRDDQFTGEVTNIPCFQDGKVKRLQTWLTENHHNLKNSTFYSDSHNDLPLLEQVSFPVAVDADEKLSQVAAQRGWPQISLR